MGHGSFVSSPVHEAWTVTPLHTPRIARRCPRCGQAREFASSDRFRLNANGRVLDAWLVYRCVRCEDSYNLPVFERRAVRSVPRALLDALHDNDRETAWRVAFEASSATVELRVTGVLAPACAAREVTLALGYSLRARLDRVLALALSMSRSAVRGRVADRRALKRPAVDGQRVSVAAALRS